MSDAILAVLGLLVVVGPVGLTAYRKRRALADAVMDRELMGHLENMRRAGEEQARDSETAVIRARYAELTRSSRS